MPPSVLLLATIALLSTRCVQPVDSLNALVFQTSFGLPVPCITRLIHPPPHHEPPARVLIATPTDSGSYPVILFKHGFLLANCFYTQLFEALASSGYIVVAPQALTANSDCTAEIEETAKVANWVATSLLVVLHAAMSTLDVVPDMSRLVMAGHSRGGKVAFAIVLGMASIDIPSFSALITLDPVDGTASESVLYPPIIAAGCNHTHNIVPVPVLILGAGHGSDTGLPGAQACAPACCGHLAYFNCSSAPIMYHLVASDYGHLDFLDDSQIWTSVMCKSGRDSKTRLRGFVAELIVTFLKSALECKKEGIVSMLDNWETASIKLEEPQVYTQDGLMKRGQYISNTVVQVAGVCLV